MNIKVRAFLIELARDPANQIIHYQELCGECELDLDMGRIDHRNEIGRILGDISRYEHESGRPLLSALVTRAGDNYEGNGFYKLAEELGLGNWKKLRESDFDIIQMRNCIDFWSNNSNYIKYKDSLL